MIYKNKIVALYDQDDVCVFVAESWQELASYLNKTLESTMSSLSHMIRHTGGHTRKTFICNGKKLTPYLIEMDEGDF